MKHRISSIKNWFLKASWKKKIAIIVIIIVVAFIATSPLRSKKTQYTIEAAKRTTISDIVSESGNVEASSQTAVRSPARGTITSLYVANGDKVVVGQHLFEVKSSATADEKSQALANYLQAKTTYESANANMYTTRSTMYSNWKKFTDLATNGTYENGDGSPNDSVRNSAAEFQQAQDNWHAAEANYKNQQNAVAQAQAALTTANLAYQSTQDRIVTSPIGGTVANLSVNVGDTVDASTTTVTAGPVMYIGTFTKHVAVIPLNEVDVNKISATQTATLTFDAMRDTPYTGHVDKIDTVGTNNAGVITYNAYVAVDNADAKVKPGMTVTVAIETNKHENVLSVPNSAIKPYNGGKAVLVPGPGNGNKTASFHYVPVTVGLKGVTDTEILSGLKDGTEVITSGVTTAQLESLNTSK